MKFFVFMRRSILLATALAVAASIAIADSVKVNFDSLTELVREQNLHAKGAALLQKSAEAKAGHLSRSYLPRLSANIGHEAYQTGTQPSRDEPYASVDLSVNLYRGGRDSLEDKLNQTQAEVAKLDSEQIFRFEIDKARRAYWNLIAQREIKALLKTAVAKNTQAVASAKERVDAGLATRSDIYEFEMYQVRLEQELARNTLEIRKSELELTVLLGFDENTSIETPSSVEHSHNDQILTTKFDPSNHPIVKSLEKQGRSAKIEAEMADRWWAPSLDLYASHGLNTFREREFDEQSERVESVIGAKASIDIFDGFDSKIESRQKGFEAAGRMAESKQTARELLAELENARTELTVAHQIIHTSERSLSIAKTYLSETVDEYKRGVKNSPDVLSALEKNLELQLKFVDLKLDYQIARMRMLDLLGD